MTKHKIGAVSAACLAFCLAGNVAHAQSADAAAAPAVPATAASGPAQDSAQIAAPSSAQPADSAPPQAATPDQQGLSDIIVTGSREGARSLQRTPIAVSVVSSALLESQGISNVKDVVGYVPNLSVSRNISGSIITLRGIGANSGEPSVTTQVDGVYIANSIAFTDFFDVDRIEVLRGPQGTLYGRNATGGTINVISRQPSDRFEGKARLSYGNYNAVEASGYVTGPLTDQLSASIALNYSGHDPYFRNIAPGGHGIASGNSGGGRLQLRWAPSSNFTATTRADYSKVDQWYESYDHLLAPATAPAPLANSLVGSYRDVALNANQKIKVKDGGISEDINWQISNHLTLTSITAWRRFLSTAYNDNDATEVNALLFRSTSDARQFTQEVDLKYSSDRLNIVAGAFYFNLQSRPGSFVQQPPSAITPAARAVARGAFGTIYTDSFAVFGQLDYEIVRDLKLVIGLRYTTETNRFDQNFQTTSLNPATLGASSPGFPVIFSIRRKDDALTPKFALNYQANDDVLLFASATKGFKSGGFNSQATVPSTAGYAPELIWSYEAGTKTEWFDKRLRLNLTGFYYDYTDLQVRQLLGPGNSAIANAASAKVKGVELEVVVKPASALQISGSVSYLDAKYDKFPAAAIPGAFAPYVPNQNCVAGVCTINVSGNQLSDAPKWTGLFAIDYSPRIGAYKATAHLDGQVTSSRYFDLSNIPLSRQPSYGLLNASLGFGPDKARSWTLELFARNLTDKKYYQTISGNGLAPGAIVGDPRTYGVRATVSW